MINQAYNIGAKSINILSTKGWRSLWQNYKQFMGYNDAKLNDYEEWILKNEPTRQELSQQNGLSKQFKYRPLISIIIPVYNISTVILEKTILSVIEQTYNNWELCIADGNSTDDAIRKILTKYSTKDSRIKLKFLKENMGISGNSNEALRLASGEFIALLDHDDLIAPFALYAVVELLNKNCEIDFIYSDKDLISEDGKRRFQPLFKPDWSPDVLLSVNYLTHFNVIRKSLLDKVGWFLPETDGAQDWDLFFRITESTQKICHIPKILYHWRSIESSCAEQGIKAKPYIFDAQKKAITNHMSRKSLRGEPVINSIGIWRIKWEITSDYLISIIIPSKNIFLLNRCIESIISNTSYKNYEIIVIDTGINKAGNSDEYVKLTTNTKIKIIEYHQPFNYSAVNNLGVKNADGNVLLFLNDDTEVITPDWLEDMLGWAEQKGIGVIGAKLLYSDYTIQHAGVVIGLTGFAGHVFSKVCENYFGMYGSTEWYRDYLAITGACMMVKRSTFEELGGFDESFILCGSDVELCLRAHNNGYRVVYDPFVKLIHHESASRDKYIPPGDFKVSYDHYKPFLESGDKYYNINLSNWSLIPTVKKSDEKVSIEFVREVLNNECKNKSN